MTGNGHLVVYHLPFEIIQRRSLAEAADLHETEPVIDEGRMPDDRLGVPGDIDIPCFGGTEIIRVEFAVFLQSLCEPQQEGVALVHLHLHLKPSYHILAHIEDVSSIRKWTDGHWLDDVLDLYVRIRLGGELAVWGLLEGSLRPSAVVIRRIEPSVQFETGVIDLAVIFVVTPDRAVGPGLPACVACDFLYLSVPIFNLKLADQAGQLLVVVLVMVDGIPVHPDSREPPRPEHHSYGIGALLKQSSDVEAVVIHLLVIIGHGRGKHLGSSHLASVDVCFVEAKPADMQPGFLDSLSCFEAGPQVSRRHGYITGADVFRGIYTYP